MVDQASARRGGGGFHGGGMRAGHGFRGGAFRGGRGFARGGVAWRGGRGWRGRGRGWGYWPYGVAAGVAGVPYYYGYGDNYYGDCPLVRRRVATSAGYRLRWVRQC